MKGALAVSLVVCLNLGLSAHIHPLQTRIDDWDFLVLAQFWAGTSCVFFRKDGCDVPTGVSGWTIHGFWPSTISTEQPAFCNDSQPFDLSQIQVLRNKLNVFWPYYNSSGVRWSLWEHEWDKHGTCASSLPSIRGELLYFNQTLQLYSNLHILNTLNNAGIFPDDTKVYNLSGVFNAIVNVYSVKPQIECYYAEGQHYLDQIYMCFSKALQLMDCPDVSLSRVRHSDNTGLFFKSERPDATDSSWMAVDSSRTRGHFVNCPKDLMVNYPPLPTTAKRSSSQNHVV